ncbi:hypothetical protein GcM3_089024, partial [Golovinomyces cichoracearum]
LLSSYSQKSELFVSFKISVQRSFPVTEQVKYSDNGIEITGYEPLPKRLLLLDGHSTHVSLEFIQKADSFRTLLLKLPSHSTQLLQPLYVALFSTLKEDYMGEISRWSHSGHNILSKSAFVKMFGTIHDGSFTTTA